MAAVACTLELVARQSELASAGVAVPGASWSSSSSATLELCRDHRLTVLNTRDCFGVPTRQRSVLDLAITNSPLLFSLSIDDLDIVSDHSSLSVHYSLPALPRQPPPSKWSTADANWELYN